MHCEAVRRISRSGRIDETIGTFFMTPYICSHLVDLQVAVKTPATVHNGIVRNVHDFSDVDFVLEELRAGFIVVSDTRTEKGLVYVSSFFTAEDETKMLVAVVQVDFSGSVAWAGQEEEDPTFTEITRALHEKGVTWFPVRYTTRPSVTSRSSTDGVYFNELALFDFTQRLGLLRIHLESLRHSFQSRCPTLARHQPIKRRSFRDHGCVRACPRPSNLPTCSLGVNLAHSSDNDDSCGA
uniref:Uncharacterized protein n=1 Tax=Neobodo designis TaxID=312471 RepID=A0A7S1MM56_NEODS